MGGSQIKPYLCAFILTVGMERWGGGGGGFQTPADSLLSLPLSQLFELNKPLHKCTSARSYMTLPPSLAFPTHKFITSSNATNQHQEYMSPQLVCNIKAAYVHVVTLCTKYTSHKCERGLATVQHSPQDSGSLGPSP